MDELSPTYEGDHVDLSVALSVLGKRGILHVFCEGGGILHSKLLSGNFVNSLLLFYGNIVIGGTGLSWAEMLQNSSNRWKLVQMKQLDNEFCVEYNPE